VSFAESYVKVEYFVTILSRDITG